MKKYWPVVLVVSVATVGWACVWLAVWAMWADDPGYKVAVEDTGSLLSCEVTFCDRSAAQCAPKTLWAIIERLAELNPDRFILAVASDASGYPLGDEMDGGMLVYTPPDGRIRTWDDYEAVVNSANEYLASPTETIDYVPDMLKEPAEPNQEEEAPEAGVRWEIVQGKYLDLESLISEGMTLEEINAAVGVEGEKNMQVGAGTKYTWHLADGQTLVGNLEDDALVGWEVHTPPPQLVMIEPPPPKPVPPPKRGVTMEDFEWIEIGMSYEGVVRYLGVPGVLTSETQYGRHYEWKGTRPYSSASVSFTRQNGVFVVDSKYQYGLK